MSGLPSLGMSPPYTPPADSAEALRRIDRNTTEIVRWAKILTGTVIVLILVTIALLI